LPIEGESVAARPSCQLLAIEAPTERQLPEATPVSRSRPSAGTRDRLLVAARLHMGGEVLRGTITPVVTVKARRGARTPDPPAPRSGRQDRWTRPLEIERRMLQVAAATGVLAAGRLPISASWRSQRGAFFSALVRVEKNASRRLRSM